ncbi:MAG: DUF3795 domain-containing protein [Candidatus Methanofastidiosa archaeon]|nr:DUF3795 domain-containing protein [Candidatus Methanofastidiosa archaeon]
MRNELIAPCGMNCNICKYHCREKMKCPGCREENEKKSKSCRDCIIINCEELKNNDSGFCYDCSKFPCRRLKALDKRYRTKYHMGMLENLKTLKEEGMDSFLEKEEQRWTCQACGGAVTCHGGMCLQCGLEKFKK